MEIIKKSKVW